MHLLVLLHCILSVTMHGHTIVKFVVTRLSNIILRVLGLRNFNVDKHTFLLTKYNTYNPKCLISTHLKILK